MIAYHGDPDIKARLLAQLAAHREAGEILHGRYWEGGRGCAIGCTLHSSDHAVAEALLGWPEVLVHLEDVIFGNLPPPLDVAWAERFGAAIHPGADLSLVHWRFLHWLLSDPAVNPGITHPNVRYEVGVVARRCYWAARGVPSDRTTWAAIAELAAQAADSTALVDQSAAEGALAAQAAARGAEAICAAKSADAAVEGAGTACAAECAELVAELVAESAELTVEGYSRLKRALRRAAQSAAWAGAGRSRDAWGAPLSRQASAWTAMADKLVELLSQQRAS